MNTNVSTKTEIENLLDQSIDQDTHKADYTGPIKSFQFDAQSNIAQLDVLGKGTSSQPLTPTPWAYGQIFQKLGTSFYERAKSLPADYLLGLRPDQRADLLNDHIQNSKANGWLLRSYDNDARAILSDKYTVINNTDLLEILHKVSTETTQPHSLTRTSSVTPDSLNVRIIWKDIDRGGSDEGGNKEWGIGTYIRNGETGNRRGGVFPLVQRHSCKNSIIVDNSTSAFEFLHLGSQAAKLTLVKAAIADVLPFAAELLDKMIAADSEKIPDIGDVIAGICKQRGWSDDVKTKIAIGTEGRETRAGLVNGITFVAHSFEDPNIKAEYETAGGAILLAPDSLFHKAASVGRIIE